MRFYLLGAMTAVLGLLGQDIAHSQTIISTLPNIDLAYGYGANPSFVSTFGQTFVAPGNTVTRFDAFEFIIQRPAGTATPLTFTAHVAAYDETTQRIVGPILASSGTNYYDNARGAQRFRVPMRATALQGGQKYVAFASANSSGNFYWQVAGSNPYSGGSMVFNGDVLGGSSAPWGTFTANNAAAPADLGTRLFFDMPYYQNVAQGKAVSLNGVFGSNAGLASSLTDGVYLPAGQQWQTNTVWWANNTASAVVDLGGLHTINALNIQADDNDAYLVEYRASASDAWTSLWTVGNAGVGPNGMQTRPDELYGNARYFLPSSITASQFRLRGDANSSDALYALSEFQAYGFASVPEPGTMALFATCGLAGIGLLRRKTLRKNR